MPLVDSSSPIFTFGMLLAKATFLLAIAFGGALLLQRAAAGARHLLWVAIIGALLLLPALSAWSPLQLAILPFARTEATTVAPVAPSGAATRVPVAEQTLADAPSAPADQAAPPQDASAAPARPPLTGWQVALLVWGIVSLLLVAWLAASFLAVRRIVDRAEPLDDRGWVAPLYEIADRLGIERTPRIVRSEAVMMPFAAGIVRPTIVLPAGCDAWDEERRRAVLMHELAHIRRRDLLGHTLGRITCALYWFHPLVWSAARRLRIESERACDDLALTCGLRPTSYAEHLLDIVSGIRQPRTPVVAIPMADRKEFEGRMLAILDPDVRRRSARGQTLSMVGGLAALVLVVAAAAPAPAAQERPSSTANRSNTSNPANLGDSSPVVSVERRQADSQERNETNVERQVTNREIATSASRGQGSLPVARPVPAAVAEPQVAPKLGIALIDTLTTKSADQRAALLIQVLKADTSSELRRVAAWGLQNYADRAEVGSALAAALRADRSAKVRETAAWALAGGDDRGDRVVALTEALAKDSDDDVRETAAWALGALGAESARDQLVSALSDRSSEVRARAMWALGTVGEGKAPKQVLDALADSSRNVRRMAAWVLFNLEDAAAVPYLERALERETDKPLRNDYIRALGAVGGESAATLARLLDSKDPDVRAAVVGALAGRHGGPWPMPQPRPRPFP